MEIYITNGIKQVGPYSEHELRDLIERKEVHEADLAWHEDLSDWVTVAEILQKHLKADETADPTDLRSISESAEMAISEPQQDIEKATASKTVSPPLPVNPPVPVSPVSSPVYKTNGVISEIGIADGDKKMVAGLLGIFLGGFGAHKFYLGYPIAGFIQLVATFATSGLAILIPIIEGMIYLTKSKDDFAKTYVIGRRSWF